MSREWNSGDVALMPDGRRAIVVTADAFGRRFACEDGLRLHGDAINGVWPRPLVVIDPENREQVERLTALVRAHRSGLALDEGTIIAALREFADPREPKPEEPKGLGAVVEDSEHRKWVRHDNTPGCFPWLRAGHGVAGWSEIDVVRVLSAGYVAEEES